MDMLGRKRPFWQRLTNLERKLILLFLAALVLIVILVCVLCSSTSSNAIRKEYQEDTSLNNIEECGSKHQMVCLTAGCIKSAAQILSYMDLSVNPCDDFYSFVCGNYVNTTHIPDDKTSVNTFSVITDELQEQLKRAFEEPIKEYETPSITKVKKFYRACIDKKEVENRGLKDALQILKELGGWPVVEGENWLEDSFSWLMSTHQFRKLGLDTSYFLDFSVGFDLKNSSQRSIQIDQPSLGLNREFLLEKSNTNLTNAYYEFMVDAAVFFGAERELAEEELKLSLEFEKKLANFSLSKEERRNISALYNPYKISDLQSEFPTIPWLGYINMLLPNNVQVTEKDIVLIVVPKYVREMERLLEITPKRVVANYAIWRAVKSIIPYLTDDIRHRELTFRKAVTGLAERPPRWKECVDELSSSLPILVGSLYVRKYFDEDSKKNAVELVRYLRNEFYNILKSVDWMDDETRKAALEKAKGITEHIAYPDELYDDKKIEDVFGELEVSEDQLLFSSLNVTIFTTDFYYSRLYQPVNKTDWIDHGNPAQVNAFYHPVENSIVFPAGILQGLLFNKDRPHYMNYGGIGTVIGHEITHGFDDTGKQFDKDGNLVDWWAKDTQMSFLEKAQCIIDQYSSYTVPEINENLNGINTQGENIADNGGVKEAYLAYRTWEKSNGQEPFLPGLDFTPYQLFWISAAMNWCNVQRPEALKLQVTTDQHSPGKFRVLGPFSNQEYFARDFSCPSGSRMNPVSKCSVW